jgi:NAD(P)H dehydrogenase (quinone)
MKLLIVYYSTYGNVYKMAQLIAEGAKEVQGVEPVIRTVPELIPAQVVESRADMKAGREMQEDVPLVKIDDFREAGAIAFGLGAADLAKEFLERRLVARSKSSTVDDLHHL